MLRNENYFDVVISGAGPAGLLAAWAALAKGKRVLLLDKRKIPSLRIQPVFNKMVLFFEQLLLRSLSISDFNLLCQREAYKMNSQSELLSKNKEVFTSVAEANVENLRKGM